MGKMIGSVASVAQPGQSLLSLKSNGSVNSVVGPARSLVTSLRDEDGVIREDAKEIMPEDGEPDNHGPARVSEWYQTSFNLMAEIMGTGILSLPSLMAGLGYALGTTAIVVFAFATYYSGVILMKVKNKYYKQILSYGDVAFILHGRAFEQVTRWLLYCNWYALMCYYVLALASCFMSAFYWRTDVCFWQWGLVAVAVLVPFIQFRTFHMISYASFVSTVSIITAAAIITASFITGGTDEALSGTFVPPTYEVPAQSFLSGYANLANVIFVFQGQSNFYEMAGEMKNPKKFLLSLGLSQCTLLTCYLFTALLAYTYGGQNLYGFILYSLPANSLRTACSLLVALHIVVAYTITCQPLVSALKPLPRFCDVF